MPTPFTFIDGTRNEFYLYHISKLWAIQNQNGKILFLGTCTCQKALETAMPILSVDGPVENCAFCGKRVVLTPLASKADSGWVLHPHIPGDMLDDKHGEAKGSKSAL